MQPVVQWFDIGGSLKLGADADSGEMVRELGTIQGLMEKTRALGLTANEPDEVRASAGEFILEGLHAHRRIGRSEERVFKAGEKKPEPVREKSVEPDERPYRQRRQFN